MWDFIKFIWEDNVGKILLISIPVLFLLFGFFTIREESAWQVFSKENDCKVVAKISGSMSTGVAPVIGGNGGVGVVMVNTPGKTGYLCKDGITYYR